MLISFLVWECGLHPKKNDKNGSSTFTFCAYSVFCLCPKATLYILLYRTPLSPSHLPKHIVMHSSYLSCEHQMHSVDLIG